MRTDTSCNYIFSLTVIFSLYWIAITLYRYQLGDWGVQNSCRSSTATWNQGNTRPFAAASSPAPGARGDWSRGAPWNGWRDNGDEPPFPRTGAWNPGRTPRRAHTCVKMSGTVERLLKLVEAVITWGCAMLFESELHVRPFLRFYLGKHCHWRTRDRYIYS